MEIHLVVSPILGSLYLLFTLALAVAFVEALCEPPERDERGRGPWGR